MVASRQYRSRQNIPTIIARPAVQYRANECPPHRSGLISTLGLRSSHPSHAANSAPRSSACCAYDCRGSVTWFQYWGLDDASRRFDVGRASGIPYLSQDRPRNCVECENRARIGCSRHPEFHGPGSIPPHHWDRHAPWNPSSGFSFFAVSGAPARSAIQLRQQLLEFHFACLVGCRHGAKENWRLLYRASPPGSINLPSPGVRSWCPVLNDNRIVAVVKAQSIHARTTQCSPLSDLDADSKTARDLSLTGG